MIEGNKQYQLAVGEFEAAYKYCHPNLKTNQHVLLKFWVASLAFGIDCSQTWL
jgi:hypothetical protein